MVYGGPLWVWSREWSHTRYHYSPRNVLDRTESVCLFSVLICCVIVSEREKTACETHRESVLAASSSSGGFSFFRPRPAVGQYVPTCDGYGAYEPTQCHASAGQCWCVDDSGVEILGSRTGPGSRPMCKSRERLDSTVIQHQHLL